MSLFFKKTKLMIRLAVLLVCTMLGINIIPSSTTVSFASSKPKFSQEYYFSYVGKTTVYNVKNLQEGYSITWNISKEAAGYVSFSKDNSRLTTKTVAVTGSNSSIKIFTSSLATKKVGTSYLVTATIYNSKARKLATLTDKVKISQDVKKIRIVNTPTNDVMYTGDSFKFDSYRFPNVSSNKTFWFVTDKDGKILANTKDKLTSSKVTITSDGIFTPKEAGVYNILAKVYRSKDATFLRATSLPIKIKVIEREEQSTVTTAPTPTISVYIPFIPNEPNTPTTPSVTPVAETITMNIEGFSKDGLYTVDNECLTLKTTVSTNTSVSKVYATFYSYINETARTIQATNINPYTITNLPLDIGANFITITAEAINGTKTTMSFTVNRNNKIVNFSDDVKAFNPTTSEGLAEIKDVYDGIINYWTNDLGTESTLDDETNLVVSNQSPLYKYIKDGVYQTGDIIFIPSCEYFPTGISFLYRSHDDVYAVGMEYDSESYEVIHTRTPGYEDMFQDAVSISSTVIDKEDPIAFCIFPEGTEISVPTIEEPEQPSIQPLSLMHTTSENIDQSTRELHCLAAGISIDDDVFGPPEDVIGRGFQFQNLTRRLKFINDFSDINKGQIELTFDQVILYDRDGNKDTKYDRVTLDGSIGLKDIKPTFGLEWNPSLSDTLPKQFISKVSYTEEEKFTLALGGESLDLSDLLDDYKEKTKAFENKRAFFGINFEGVDLDNTIVLGAVGFRLGGAPVLNIKSIQSESIHVPFNPIVVILFCADVEGKLSTKLIFDFETTSYVEKGINVQKDGFIGNYGTCAQNLGTENYEIGDRNINIYNVRAKSEFEKDKFPVSKLTISAEGNAEASLAVGGGIGIMMAGVMPALVKGTVGPYTKAYLNGQIILASDADPVLQGEASINLRLRAMAKVNLKLITESFMGKGGLEFNKDLLDVALLEFNASSTAYKGKVYASDSDRDLSNNLPLSNAKITLTNKNALPTSNSYYFEVLTANDGSFSIDNIAAGDYLLSISKDGFTTIIDHEVTISGTGAEQDFYMDANVISTASLTGLVTVADADTNGTNNAPLGGITVTLTKIGSSFTTPSQTTDGTGSYSFSNLPLGLYEISISDSRYIPITSEVLISSATSNIYNITLEAIDNSYLGNGVACGIIIDALSGRGVDAGLMLTVRKGNNMLSGDVVASITTDADGKYSLNLAAGNYTVYVSDNRSETTLKYHDGYFNIKVLGGITIDNQNGEVTPILDNGEIRIVLNWGSKPNDLDSHLNGLTADGISLHTFYDNKTYADATTKVLLDVDDTTSYGPETTTIYHQVNGVYKFTVHDYSNREEASSTELANSGAYVRVYINGEILTYYVPYQEGTAWDVFEYNSATNTITVLNKMYYATNPVTVGSLVNQGTLARSFSEPDQYTRKDYEEVEEPKAEEAKAEESKVEEDILNEVVPEESSSSETNTENVDSAKTDDRDEMIPDAVDDGDSETVDESGSLYDPVVDINAVTDVE